MNLDTYAIMCGTSMHALAEAKQHPNFLIKLILIITKMSATILQGTIQGSWTIVHLDKLPTFGRRLSSRIYKMHKIQLVCHIQFSSGLTLPDDRLNYPMILQANSEAPIREHKLEGLYRSSLSTNVLKFTACSCLNEP